MSLLSLNLSLNTDDLTNNRIGKHQSLGQLCVDDNGKICLLDEFYTDNDSCLSSPANSIGSVSKSLSDYEFVKDISTNTDEKEDKYDELEKRLSKIDLIMKYEKVLKSIRSMVMDDEEEIEDEDEIEDDKYNDLEDKFKDLEYKYCDLLEKMNEIKSCECNCNHLNDQEITEATFPEKHLFSWNQQAYENLSSTKNKFVKLNGQGELIICDILSNCLGVTLDNEVESEICINGICEVEEYKKGICVVGRKSSLKNGLAIAGSQFIITERIDENHVKIILK